MGHARTVGCPQTEWKDGSIVHAVVIVDPNGSEEIHLGRHGRLCLQESSYLGDRVVILPAPAQGRIRSNLGGSEVDTVCERVQHASGLDVETVVNLRRIESGVLLDGDGKRHGAS